MPSSSTLRIYSKLIEKELYINYHGIHSRSDLYDLIVVFWRRILGHPCMANP